MNAQTFGKIALTLLVVFGPVSGAAAAVFFILLCTYLWPDYLWPLAAIYLSLAALSAAGPVAGWWFYLRRETLTAAALMAVPSLLLWIHGPLIKLLHPQ